MGTFNPIPSKFSYWSDTGRKTKNIPITNILEDVFYKDSRKSYFIQLADFRAYALLRNKIPLPSKTKYGIDSAFNILAPVGEPEISGTRNSDNRPFLRRILH